MSELVITEPRAAEPMPSAQQTTNAEPRIVSMRIFLHSSPMSSCRTEQPKPIKHPDSGRALTRSPIVFLKPLPTSSHSNFRTPRRKYECLTLFTQADSGFALSQSSSRRPPCALKPGTRRDLAEIGVGGGPCPL